MTAAPIATLADQHFVIISTRPHFHFNLTIETNLGLHLVTGDFHTTQQQLTQLFALSLLAVFDLHNFF